MRGFFGNQILVPDPYLIPSLKAIYLFHFVTVSLYNDFVIPQWKNFKFFRYTEHKYDFLRLSLWNSSDSNQLDITESSSCMSASPAACKPHSHNSWKLSLFLRVHINIPQRTSNKARELIYICIRESRNSYKAVL